MIRYALQTLIFFSLLFSIGQMPKGWDKPSFNKEESQSVSGLWSIDIDKIVEAYKKTPEYEEAGEYSEMAVNMIKEIFALMKFKLKDDGSYILSGVPNPNGEIEDLNGLWFNENDLIILKSPQDNNGEDLIFKLSGDTLIPQNENASMFYLKKEK